MKVISIIVPTYNVENYIEKCLESFLIQECFDDVEVLVINDGSTDHSSQIAQKFANEYPQLFRVITKKNGGHGSAINRGIEESHGKYFKVVDSDDWVERRAFIHLISFLKQSNVDMVLSNYLWVDESTGASTPEIKELCPGITYQKEYPFEAVDDRLFLKMHAITFRTEILKQMPVRLDEHCFYVDTEYIIYPLPYVQTVAFLSDYVYQYRVGLPSQSMNIVKMQERCKQHEQVLNSLLTYYGSLSTAAKKVCMKKYIARVVCSQYKIYLSYQKSHKKDLILMERRLKNNYPDIYYGVANKGVIALRRSAYLLYPLASFTLRCMVKC